MSSGHGAARRAAPLLVTLLLATGLTACSSDTESYCSALKDDQKQLKRLSARSDDPGAGGSKALEGTVSLLSDLGDKAPDDISGDWDTLVQALQGLVDAIKASGADVGDFQGNKKPAGVTGGQLKAVQQAAAELQATPVQQAGKSIEQHAQDVCKVDLGSGLGGAG